MADEGRWARVWELFHEVAELPTAERPARIEELAGDDPGLRDEVESLLAARDDDPGFLADHRLIEPLVGPEDDPLLGRMVGGCRLDEVVGEGGMGTVYRAEQVEPVRRRVAVKVIKLGMDTREVVARFDAERQALALMDHPGIAAVYGGGATDGGRPYFVMEWVEGEPITAWCDAHRLSLDRRIALFVALCRAVEHAHQKGVLHRDLKPGNVLVVEVDGAPRPKVIDFGVAKALDARLTERTLATELGRIVGTPEYMSPEQAAGAAVDTRSDLYSLGVLLYELLVGVLPFERAPGASWTELERRVREEEPSRPSRRARTLGGAAAEIAARRRRRPAELADALAGDLDWIVVRTLAKAPDERYASVSELAADLERALRHEPVAARPPSARDRMAKFVRRHRVAVTAAAAVAVALLAGAIGTGVMALRAARERDAAEAARDEARREAATARATSDFLVSTLAAPDPYESAVDPERAREVRVVEVLERASATMASELADEPAVEAELRSTLGTTYSGLGLYDEAERELARALELRRELAGDPVEASAMRAEHALVTLEQRRGRLAEAETRLRPLLERQRARLGPEHRDTLASLHTLAGLLYERGELEASEAAYRAAFEAVERVAGPDDPQTLAAKNDLAFILEARRQLDESERLYRATLEARRRVLGELHPSTLVTLNNLAGIHVARNDLDGAATLYREVLDGRRRVHGGDHPDTLNVANNLAVVLYRQERFDEAAGLFAETRESMIRALGPDHPRTMAATNNLARLLLRLDRVREAEALFSDLLPRAERSLPADNGNLAIFRHGYGRCLTALGRWDEAERLLAAARGQLLRQHGADHPRTQSVQASLDELAAARRQATSRSATAPGGG